MYDFIIKTNVSDYLDYRQFMTQYKASNNTKTRFLRWFSLALIPIYFICYFLGTTDLGMEFLLLIAFLAIVAWIPFITPLARWLIKRQVNQKRKAGISLYPPEMRVIFDDESFSFFTEESESVMKYSAIMNIIVSYTDIIVVLSDHSGFPIPFAAFSDKAKREQFIAFLQNKTADKLTYYKTAQA